MNVETLPPQKDLQPEADLVSYITREAAGDIRLLSKLHPWHALAAIAGDWLIIALSISLAIVLMHPIAYFLAGVAIATRQHALLIIMHDASHYRLLSNRLWNDRVSNWLLAYPMLVTTESYRCNHLDHHRHLNSDKDPDWVRKKGHEEWEFPKSRLSLMRLFVRDLLGGGFLDTLKAIYCLSGDVHQKRTANSTKKVAHLFYYIIVLASLFASGYMWLLLGLWFIPAFTILPVILRIRSIAEHFGLEGSHDLNSSRNYHCGWLERVLIAPHNVGYHLVHHLFPSVPFYNLAAMHIQLDRISTYQDYAHNNLGLVGTCDPTVERDVTLESV